MRLRHCIGPMLFVIALMSTSLRAEDNTVLISQAEFARAEQVFQSGDLTRASQLYAKILEKDSAQPFAWFRLGLAHQQLQHLRPALQAYDSALSYAQTALGSPELEQTIAKTRFNRAMLLLDLAAQDLQQIPPDRLDAELEATRTSVNDAVSAALRSANSREKLEPISSKKSRAQKRARAYVYTAVSPTAPATTVGRDTRSP